MLEVSLHINGQHTGSLQIRNVSEVAGGPDYDPGGERAYDVVLVLDRGRHLEHVHVEHERKDGAWVLIENAIRELRAAEKLPPAVL